MKFDRTILFTFFIMLIILSVSFGGSLAAVVNNYNFYDFLFTNGTRNMSGTLNMSGNNISNILSVVAPSDAVNLSMLNAVNQTILNNLTNYAYKPGLPGGQVLNGGIAGNSLTLNASANSTASSFVIIAPTGEHTGIGGITSPNSVFAIKSAGSGAYPFKIYSYCTTPSTPIVDFQESVTGDAKMQLWRNATLNILLDSNGSSFFNGGGFGIQDHTNDNTFSIGPNGRDFVLNSTTHWVGINASIPITDFQVGTSLYILNNTQQVGIRTVTPVSGFPLDISTTDGGNAISLGTNGLRQMRIAADTISAYSKGYSGAFGVLDINTILHINANSNISIGNKFGTALLQVNGNISLNRIDALTDAVNKSYSGVYGVASTVSDGATIVHALGTNPTACFCTGTVANTSCSVSTKTTTYIQINGSRTNNTNLYMIPQNIYWECRL